LETFLGDTFLCFLGDIFFGDFLWCFFETAPPNNSLMKFSIILFYNYNTHFFFS
jgi:hypothetical protein